MTHISNWLRDYLLINHLVQIIDSNSTRTNEMKAKSIGHYLTGKSTKGNYKSDNQLISSIELIVDRGF